MSDSLSCMFVDAGDVRSPNAVWIDLVSVRKYMIPISEGIERMNKKPVRTVFYKVSFQPPHTETFPLLFFIVEKAISVKGSADVIRTNVFSHEESSNESNENYNACQHIS